MGKSKPKRRRKNSRARRRPGRPGRKGATRSRRPKQKERRVLNQASRQKAERARATRSERVPLPVLVRRRLGGAGAWVALQWRRLPAGVRSPANLALGAGLGLLVVALVVILLIRSTPGYYRDPDTISDEQLIQWGEGFVGKANDLLTGVVNQKGFDVTVTEEEVNGYLAGFFRPEVRRALPARLSEEFRLELPPGFRGLMVHLGEGEVVLMARYEASRFRPVLSLAGRIYVDPQGKCRFEPLRARAGRAPVPGRWLPFVAELASKSVSLRKQHVRIERIEVHEGKLRVVGRYEPSGDE